MTDAPAITFSLFVLSLSATAEVHLGLLPAPGGDGPAPVNLTEAAHLIGVIEMLEEKTRGNLDESEQRLVEAVLYDLRMRYVEAAAAASQAAGAPTPGAGPGRAGESKQAAGS
jgi:hypothetical protein